MLVLVFQCLSPLLPCGGCYPYCLWLWFLLAVSSALKIKECSGPPSVLCHDRSLPMTSIGLGLFFIKSNQREDFLFWRKWAFNTMCHWHAQASAVNRQVTCYDLHLCLLLCLFVLLLTPLTNMSKSNSWQSLWDTRAHKYTHSLCLSWICGFHSTRLNPINPKTKVLPILHNKQ